MMGMVTNVFWECPGCGSREQAQAYGENGDPTEFPIDAVPSDRSLKWNPPCSKCGGYYLTMPTVLVKCEPKRVQMSANIEVEHVKSARKQHRCDWCGEAIEASTSYQRWRVYGDDVPGVVKAHAECAAAILQDPDPYADEGFMKYSNPRGCYCRFSAGCPTCEARKSASSTQGGE